GVHIGDPITPNGYYQVLNNPDFISAKSWDDRVGVSLLCESCMNLKDVETEATIYFGGTVQEEVGIRGAKTVGQMVEPDLSIAIDVYPCNDTANDAPNDFKLGKGFGIGVIDTTSIGHTGLIKCVEKICEEHGIPYQETMITRGGTDSGELHLVGKGSVNINLCIPNRYVHTQRSIINRKDYDAALNFLTIFLKEINQEMFEEILNDKK
ncbi:MAG: peptidase M28, partial [Traorella sp.]